MTEEEIKKTVNAINHHGVFLHAGVKAYFEQKKEATHIHNDLVTIREVVSEEPCIAEGEKRRADLRVSMWCRSDGLSQKEYAQIELICECKRVWADKSRFVFFPPTEGYGMSRRLARLFTTSEPPNPTDGKPYTISTRGCWPFFNNDEATDIISRFTTEGLVISDGNQRSGVKGDKNILENAANQVCSAYWGLTEKLTRDMDNGAVLRDGHFCSIPLLITNSPLYICRYDADKIDLTNGTISPSNCELEEVPWLIYEHPYPRNNRTILCKEDFESYPDRKDAANRESIIVVSASHLDNLLALKSIFLPLMQLRARMYDWD